MFRWHQSVNHPWNAGLVTSIWYKGVKGKGKKLVNLAFSPAQPFSYHVSFRIAAGPAYTRTKGYQDDPHVPS